MTTQTEETAIAQRIAAAVQDTERNQHIIVAAAKEWNTWKYTYEREQLPDRRTHWSLDAALSMEPDKFTLEFGDDEFILYALDWDGDHIGMSVPMRWFTDRDLLKQEWRVHVANTVENERQAREAAEARRLEKRLAQYHELQKEFGDAS